MQSALYNAWHRVILSKCCPLLSENTKTTARCFHVCGNRTQAEPIHCRGDSWQSGSFYHSCVKSTMSPAPGYCYSHKQLLVRILSADHWENKWLKSLCEFDSKPRGLLASYYSREEQMEIRSQPPRQIYLSFTEEWYYYLPGKYSPCLLLIAFVD